MYSSLYQSKTRDYHGWHKSPPSRKKRDEDGAHGMTLYLEREREPKLSLTTFRFSSNSTEQESGVRPPRLG